LTFFYQGQERFRGLWGSPTPCAMYMAAGALTSLAVSLWCWKHRQRLPAAVAILAMLGFEYLLVITYSRASYLGFLGSALFLTRLRPRWMALGAAIAFLLIAVAVPSGASRLAGIVDHEDTAVRNRFLIWQGTAAMISNHWATGYSSTPFYDEHKAWYGDESMKNAVYRTSVNGFLHCGARYGLLAMATLVACSIWLASWLLYAGWCEHNLFFLAAAGTVFVFICGNIFSTQFDLLPWNAGMLVVGGIVIWKVLQLWPQYRRQTLILGGASTVAAGFAAGGVLLVASDFERRREFEFHPRGGWIGSPAYSLVELAPNPLASTTLRSEVILILSDESNAEGLRRAMNGLLRDGWRVFYSKIESVGLPELEQVMKILSAIDRRSAPVAPPVHIIAAGSAAQLAFVAACQTPRVEGVAVIDMVFHWPYPRLSPLDRVAEFESRLFVLRSRSADQTTAENRFIEKCQKAGIVVRMGRPGVDYLAERGNEVLAETVADWVQQPRKEGSSMK
jgi:hypothetical protein